MCGRAATSALLPAWPSAKVLALGPVPPAGSLPLANARHTAQRTGLRELVSICRGGVVPTPGWHAIPTQGRCPGSQMFSGSAEKLGIAGVEGTFPMAASGICLAGWRPEKSWHWQGLGSGPRSAAGTAQAGLLGQSQVSTPGASAPRRRPSSHAPPAAGKLQAGWLRAVERPQGRRQLSGPAFPQDRWSQRLGHRNPCSPPVRGMAPNNSQSGTGGVAQPAGPGSAPCSHTSLPFSCVTLSWSEPL